MKERLRIKREFFSGKFRILEVPSGQVVLKGQWNQTGTRLEVMDVSGTLLVTADKKTPKGIHLSWNETYVIHFADQKISTELKCIKPFKNLWEAKIEDSNFKLNSPLRKDVEIQQDNELQLKEIEEDEFYVKANDKSKKIALIAFYLCIRQQHSDPTMVD